jgi:leader peptidase (prepilin peptidase)/N-methyltransferase
MMTAIYATIGILGLAVGSFLNVLIYRIPRGKTFTKGRSACLKCGQAIKWYHNIPVLSFLFLRGRCAFCSARIPWRYPVVEVANAALWLFFFWQFDLTYQFFVFSGIASVLLAIFFIDIDFQIIPDMFTLPGMVIGLGISLLPGGIGIIESGIGLLVGGGSLFLIAILGDWLFKKESMGGGDIKMAAMLGSFLGWQQVLFIFMASAVIGLVVSLAVMAFSAKLRQHRVIPFGPFLALAAILAITYGNVIIGYYTSNFLQPH